MNCLTLPIFAVAIPVTLAALTMGAKLGEPMSFLRLPAVDVDPEHLDDRLRLDELPYAPEMPVVPAKRVDDALFPQFDEQGLPQWQSGYRHLPVYQGKRMPEDLYEALLNNVQPAYRGWYAGVAWEESKWEHIHHFDSVSIPKSELRRKGVKGHSWGMFQIHDYWRYDDYAAMGSMWNNAEMNLWAFKSTLMDHKEYWPSTSKSLREAAARYNGGNKPNYKYADSVMKHAEKLQPFFTTDA